MIKSVYGTDIDTSSVVFDMEDIRSNTENFKNKFEELKNVKEGNKVSIWYDKIYLDGSIWGLQWAWRKSWGQGRETVKKYLINKFDDYAKFLEMLVQAEIHGSHESHEEILEIMKNNKEFIELIKPGLINIQNTYIEDLHLQMSQVISKIIIDLDKFVNIYGDCMQVKNDIAAVVRDISEQTENSGDTTTSTPIALSAFNTHRTTLNPVALMGLGLSKYPVYNNTLVDDMLANNNISRSV
jgi:hypothetical protein